MMDTKSLTKTSLLIALLCISSYIIIPLSFTPVEITAQTLIVNMTSLLQSPNYAFITIGVYILLGVCGLPVFAGGTSGIGKLFGPTGGFYFGFLVAAPLISAIKGKNNNPLRYCAATIAGIPIIYFIGIIFMCWFGKMPVKAALVAAVLPFIPGDIIKCIAAAFLSSCINKAISEYHGAA